jgi:hypothetical protein
MQTARVIDLPAELFGCSVERYVTIHTCVCDCENQQGCPILFATSVTNSLARNRNTAVRSSHSSSTRISAADFMKFRIMFNENEMTLQYDL